MTDIAYTQIGGIDVTLYGGIKNKSFIPRIRHAYESLPPLLKDFCESSAGHSKGKSLKIVLGRKMSDTDAYETPNLAPTIDDPRTHVDQVLGCYDTGKKQLTINSVFLKTIFNKSQQSTENLLVCGELYWKDAFRHELGHYFSDTYCNAGTKHNLGAAWERDVALAGGIWALREKGYGYYVQDQKIQQNPNRPDLDIIIRGATGREEVFAEAFAHFHGGGARKELHTVFPESFQQIQKIMNGFYGVHEDNISTDSWNQRIHHCSLSA